MNYKETYLKPEIAFLLKKYNYNIDKTRYMVNRDGTLVESTKDMGSGLNDKRKGFTKLCNLVVNGKINKVVIEHKDRLTRFQYNLIEFFFNSYGVEIELLDKKECTEQEELVNDMMMLIASFSGKVYSLRAQENRKKRKQEQSKI